MIPTHNSSVTTEFSFLSSSHEHSLPFTIIGMLSILVVFPFLESHISGSIHCIALWVRSLSLNKSGMHPWYCCKCRLRILFYCQVIFHCMNIPHLYYPFTIEGCSDCSQVLTTPHAECRFLCEYNFSFFLGKYLGLLDHVISPCDPMDYTVHGVLLARILEWVAVLFANGSSRPRNRTRVSCTAGGFFTSWATREAPNFIRNRQTVFHSGWTFYFPISSIWKFRSLPVFLFKKKDNFIYLFMAVLGLCYHLGSSLVTVYRLRVAVASPCSGVLLQSTHFRTCGLP